MEFSIRNGANSAMHHCRSAGLSTVSLSSSAFLAVIVGERILLQITSQFHLIPICSKPSDNDCLRSLPEQTGFGYTIPGHIMHSCDRHF